MEGGQKLRKAVSSQMWKAMRKMNSILDPLQETACATNFGFLTSRAKRINLYFFGPLSCGHFLNQPMKAIIEISELCVVLCIAYSKFNQNKAINLFRTENQCHLLNAHNTVRCSTKTQCRHEKGIYTFSKGYIFKKENKQKN